MFWYEFIFNICRVCLLTLMLSQEKFHRDAQNRSHPALAETTPMPQNICYTIPLTGRRGRFPICPVTAPPNNKWINIEHCLRSFRHSYNEKHLLEQIICLAPSQVDTVAMKSRTPVLDSYWYSGSYTAYSQVFSSQQLLHGHNML